jgi:DDE superfamily endonuclease
MEDVLAVYHRPYDPRRPVVCLDETSKVLHSTPHGSIPMQPGASARQDYEYERHGTASLFLSIEPLGGRRYVRVRERRTTHDFAEVLRALVDEDYPEADTIVLVVDNLNTHHPGALYEHFAPAEARRLTAKLEWHYTPEHGSWLNMAECELAVLTGQCLKRPIPDLAMLTHEVTAWYQRRNRAHVAVHWQFTAADARIKLRRLYPALEEQYSP